MAKRRQQGGDSVIIWAGIVNQSTIGPFKVNERFKLNCANNCNSIDKTFFALYKSESNSFKVKCVFMHNNPPLHVSKLTCEFFKHKSFTREKIMEWSLSRPDLNQIENL